MKSQYAPKYTVFGYTTQAAFEAGEGFQSERPSDNLPEGKKDLKYVTSAQYAKDCADSVGAEVMLYYAQLVNNRTGEVVADRNTEPAKA